MTYPADWPRCPACGEPALDGHITCGSFACNEAWHRRRLADDFIEVGKRYDYQKAKLVPGGDY